IDRIEPAKTPLPVRQSHLVFDAQHFGVFCRAVATAYHKDLGAIQWACVDVEKDALLVLKDRRNLAIIIRLPGPPHLSNRDDHEFCEIAQSARRANIKGICTGSRREAPDLRVIAHRYLAGLDYIIHHRQIAVPLAIAQTEY